MSDLVQVSVSGDVATITIDDGKVNALSPAVLAATHCAFDDATQSKVVVVTGRQGIFSAGFDLSVLRAGGGEAVDLLESGFRLAEKIVNSPVPVIAAVGGHAMAMGTFLVLSTDYRIGPFGHYKIAVNEVSIGMTVPLGTLEICRRRLTPSALHRAVTLSHVFENSEALAAGFFDELVPVDAVLARAHEVAATLASLDGGAYRSTKDRLDAAARDAIQAGISQDIAALR